jgi:TPR repeat protein
VRQELQIVSLFLVFSTAFVGIGRSQEAETSAPESTAHDLISTSVRPAYDLWRGTAGQVKKAEAERLAHEAATTQDPVASLFEARMVCFPAHDAFPPTDFRRINQVALKTLPEVRAKADQGDALAQYLLAFCLQHGVGVIQDTTSAMQLHEKAANAGITAAMVAMGQLTEKTKQWDKAREWYEKAAVLGDFQAQICIGDFYQYGNGVSKDMTQAMQWVQKAANSGDAYSQWIIGYWLTNGTGGIPVDRDKAAEWFRKSADNGYAPAKQMLPKPAPAELGIPAKELMIAEWVKGTTVALEQGRGKIVIVVEFWATWCPPCRDSILHLTKLAEKYKDKGVLVAGLTNEDADTVKPFVEKQGDKMAYNVGIDADRKTNKNYMEAFQENGIPTAFIVDKQGRVVWHGHPMVGLDEALEQVVNGKYDVEAAKKSELASTAAAKYKVAVQESGDGAEAKTLGEQVLRDAGPKWNVLNELAWYILTNPQLKNRDKVLAVKLARKGCEASSFKNAMVLDTYARALFETGKKAEAIKQQKAALKYVTSESDRKVMQEAMDRYTGKSKD